MSGAFHQAILRACSSLDPLCEKGLQPLTGDASLSTVFAHSELRRISQERKMDLGFDPGPERFATHLALRLCGKWLPHLPRLTQTALQFAQPPVVSRRNFFVGDPAFPYDVDTTSVSAACLFESGLLRSQDSGELLRQSASELARARYRKENVRTGRFLPIPSNTDVVMVYWMDDEELLPLYRRPQFDPTVALNAVYAALLAGEQGLIADADELVAPSLAYAENYLTSGRWKRGTLYYPSPDSFLCQFSCLIHRFNDLATPKVVSALATALIERENTAPASPAAATDAPVNLAQRIISIDCLNLACGHEKVSGSAELKARLAALQGEDGLWEAGAVYSYAQLEFYMGSRELTAAYAICALGGQATRPPSP